MKTRILLAEDNKDTAEIVSFVLHYEVIRARDGVEIHALRSSSYRSLRSSPLRCRSMLSPKS